jgi:hypothetical protein
MNLQDAATVAETPAFDPAPWRKWIVWDGFVLLLPIVAALPLLLLQAESLWEQWPWRFFPLSIAAVAVYAFFLWRSNSLATAARQRVAVGIFAVGTALLLLAVWSVDPWTACLACIVCFLAWALGRSGDRPWHRSAAWSCIALTALPLPFGFDVWLHRRLISKSAQYASSLLDVVGVPHLMAGGQIRLQDISFDLQACANNLSSIFALWSVAVCWCVVRNRSLLHCLLLMLAAGVWYILTNTLQIFYIAYAWQSDGWDLSRNPEFGWLASVVTLICLACLLMTDQLFKILLKPSPLSDPAFLPVFATLNTILCWPRDPLQELGVDSEAGESELDIDEEEEEEEEDFYPSQADSVQRPEPADASDRTDGDLPATASENRLTRRVLVGLCVAVAVAGIAPWAAWMEGKLRARRGIDPSSIAPLELAIAEETLPELWKDWKRTSFAQQSLNESRWTYQWKGQAVLVSLSPRELWDGTPVSINTGWRTNSVQLVRAPRPAANWPWAFCEMKNELGGLAYVFHSGLNAAAEPIEDFQETQLATNQNMLGLLRDGSDVPQWNYQFQLSCESGEPLTSAELQELQQAFLFFRQQLVATAQAN